MENQVNSMSVYAPLSCYLAIKQNETMYVKHAELMKLNYLGHSNVDESYEIQTNFMSLKKILST